MIGYTVRSRALCQGDLIHVESANRLRNYLLLVIEVVSVDFEQFWAFLGLTILYHFFYFFISFQKLDLKLAHSPFDKP